MGTEINASAQLAALTELHQLLQGHDMAYWLFGGWAVERSPWAPDARKGNNMEINEEKIDEVVLALLYLNFYGDHDAVRAWKSFDWEAMDRLYQKGFISDPKSKAKSVLVTDEGKESAKKLFEQYFGS